MRDDLWNGRGPIATTAPPQPEVTDRATWQAQLDDLLVREKAHTREGDAIAAARLPLPCLGTRRGPPRTRCSQVAGSARWSAPCATTTGYSRPTGPPAGPR